MPFHLAGNTLPIGTDRALPRLRIEPIRRADDLNVASTNCTVTGEFPIAVHFYAIPSPPSVDWS
jgi:hypothetical protein